MHWKIDLAKLHILNSLPCTSLELVKPRTNISAARRSASSSTNLASKYSIVQACSFFLGFIFSAFSSTLYFLMRFRNRSACLTFIALLFVLLPKPSASQETSWQKDLATWRTQYVAHLAILHLEGETVTLNPPLGGFPPDFLVAGAPAKSQPLRAEANNDKVSPHLTIGTLNIYVIRREARFALRIKDSHSPAITGFHGLHWYAPNPVYRVTAEWIPFSPRKTITLATLVGTSYDQPVPGSAEFTLAGKTFRLEPVLEDPAVAKLFFILRDTTSTSTTYGACRFLYTGFPTNGLDKPGELVLDFNRLENPPCAYTPHSTCPLPPPGNRLPIPLPVGERRYHN